MIDTKWKASVEKGPRSLNANEIRVIESFAENVSEEEKRQILFDLARLSVRSVTDDGELLEFDIEGYERPPYSGQDQFAVDARILDSDGADIGIILFLDQHDRLLELEYIRWDLKEIQDPRWATLSFRPLRRFLKKSALGQEQRVREDSKSSRCRLLFGPDVFYTSMNLDDLEESEVLSIALDQQHLCFEMVVRAEDGIRYKLSVWNSDGVALDVTFGALNLSGQHTDSSNRYTFGELESVSIVENVLTLEGDFGDLAIRNATTSIKQLR